MAQKVTKYFGHFSMKICRQELLKITQSGHTDKEWLLRLVYTMTKMRYFCIRLAGFMNLNFFH